MKLGQTLLDVRLHVDDSYVDFDRTTGSLLPSISARNGVFSTHLAQYFFERPSPIFKGEIGFMQQITGEVHLDPESFGDGKNTQTSSFRLSHADQDAANLR